MINRITIQSNEPTFVLKTAPAIVLKQEIVMITINAEQLSSPVSLKPFSFTATEGQTVFVLPSYALMIICLFVSGLGQDGLNADFSLEGNTITLNEGIPVGYRVYGTYQELPS
jgi:hypothetical protein